MPKTRPGALALLTVSTMLLAAPVAAGYNSVSTGSGDSWGVHDGAAPGLDTGSIRDTTGNALRGYGGIRVRVAGALTGRAAVMNGELMRGFGLRYDGYDRFRTTQAVQLGAVSITRAMRIQRNDRWARWYDTFTNTTTQSTTVEVVFAPARRLDGHLWR